MHFERTPWLCLCALACASSAAAQAYFANGSAQIPATGSYTENVDFADIDLDGDWDAALADGGDIGNDQNRLYVNSGGLQGGVLGQFTDGTAVQFPISSKDARDVEFADFDSDGDQDLASANTATFTNQGDELWINMGGAQGASLGVYTNQTSTRWVGLGGLGSSIAPAGVLPTGGFIDWSGDVDFADLDGDGDIDLFHSSYGGAFGGQVPSRIFLNNGQGFFSEHNPSGVQLTGSNIPNGTPGLWCEGIQQDGTTNSTGAFCDIAVDSLDIEPMDIDGDLDVDIVLHSRSTGARVYRNRLDEVATLIYRDVSGSSLPVGFYSGSDNFATETGDLDRDGDVDLIGVNFPGLNDAVYENVSTPGNLLYANTLLLASSGNDDNDADFADYDGDGNLEIYIAAFANSNRLYHNDYAGGASGSYSFTYLPGALAGAAGDRSLDAEAADIENDGDYDVLTAEDANQNEVLRLNVLAGSADVRAPRIAHVEVLDNAVAQAGPRRARAQVYDTGGYYTTWYNHTSVALSVDGCALPAQSARSGAAQIFRASLPGNLVGNVSYSWSSTDEHGNTGSSASSSYTGSSSLPFDTHYGFASPGSAGLPQLDSLSAPFVNSTYYAALKNVAAGKSVYVYVNSAPLLPGPGGTYIPGLGQINLGGTTLLRKAGVANASGCFVGAFDVPNSPSLVGAKVYVQGLALDGVAGDLLASTDGIELTLQ